MHPVGLIPSLPSALTLHPGRARGAMLAAVARRMASVRLASAPLPCAVRALSMGVFRSSNPRELRRIGINALERSRSMSLAVEPAAQQLSFSMDVGPLACHLIRDNYGAWTKKRRRGRGIGSGRGRKSGRGQKGMKARAGNKGILQRSGRQSVLEDKVPKSGFHRPRLRYKLLSLHRLQDVISSGRLPVPEDRPITVKDLFDHKILTLRQVRVEISAADAPSARPTCQFPITPPPKHTKPHQLRPPWTRRNTLA